MHFTRSATACAAVMLLATATQPVVGQQPAGGAASPATPVGSQGAASSSSGPASPASPGAGAPRRAPVDELEPGVNTSSAAQSGHSEAPAAAAPLTGTSAPGAAPAGASGAGKGDHTPAAAAATTAPKATVAKPSGSKPGKAADRLELDTTDITGNRELPKVLYIVPWKRSDLGDLTGKPVNSLLDEVLQPVDRDVFKRENRYYRAVSTGDAGAAGAAAAQSAERDARQTRGAAAPPQK